MGEQGPVPHSRLSATARIGNMVLIGVLVIGAGAAYEIMNPPSGIESSIARLSHYVHRGSILVSAWATLTIYQFANMSGWHDRLKWRNLKNILHAPFMALSGLTGLLCWLTVGNTYAHWWAQTSFFAVFIVWDLAFWLAAKEPYDNVAARCEAKARYWLFHSDLFTPLLLWASYLIVTNSVPADAQIAAVPASDLLLGGVVIAILLTSAWNWTLDLLLWEG